MSSEAISARQRHDPARLTLEELVAIQPHHIRGKLEAGSRGPEGERPGRGRANTLDFDGLSPYAPGDDIRAIDWRATSRSGRTTVRRYSAASYRAHMLVVDLRPDLYFGTEGALMAKTACLAAAWTAWRALLLHEPVGLSVGGQTIAPKRGRRHVLRLMDTLATAFAQAATGKAPPVDCEATAAMVGKRDELCLITDMPADLGPLISAGRVLSRSRVLRLLLIEDQLLTQPPRPGRYPVRGPDGRRQVIRISRPGAPDDSREAILKDAGWIVVRAQDLLPRRQAP